jgi:hypothetical protein
MCEQWDYQVRIDLADKHAETTWRDPGNPALQPLADVLARHRATMRCQYDAFAIMWPKRRDREGKAIRSMRGKATIENPEKKAKYLKSFALYVDGKAVYAKPLADALEAELKPLVGGMIARLSKRNTNPANNRQIPPQYRKG